MKGDFIIKFLEGLKDTMVEIGSAWSRRSYKGFRYSDFNFDDCSNRKKYVGFKNLENRGFIKKQNNDCFIFTKTGRLWLENSCIKYVRQKNGEWDKKWRIIIFDIPKEFDRERVKFRRKLKSMGSAALQKSVFAFPYSCDEEIGDICSNLKISDFVDLIVAESVGFREEELLKFFNLESEL